MNYHKLYEEFNQVKLESLFISPVYILAGFLKIELEPYLERMTGPYIINLSFSANIQTLEQGWLTSRSLQNHFRKSNLLLTKIC